MPAIVLYTAYYYLRLPLCASLYFAGEKKNAPTEYTFCQGRIKLSAVPPWIHGKYRALSRIPTYPRQLTHAHALQNTLCFSHLTAPSAVHLTTCFLPDSQHRRLSVKALLPLSPLHRFSVLNYQYNTTDFFCCQQFLKKFLIKSLKNPNGKHAHKYIYTFLLNIAPICDIFILYGNLFF